MITNAIIKEFLSHFENVHREGIADLLDYLFECTDFYKAPASSNGHDNCEGGLLIHSLKVYNTLLSLTPLMHACNHTVSSETLKIVALLHDVCKADFYETSTRNRKDPDTGSWYQEPYITINDKFPVGHGEKSVIIIQRFMNLSNQEIMAIRWHMGGFDDTARTYAGGFTLAKAMQGYPLIAYLHAADLLACIPEVKKCQ